AEQLARGDPQRVGQGIELEAKLPLRAEEQPLPRQAQREHGGPGDGTPRAEHQDAGDEARRRPGCPAEQVSRHGVASTQLCRPAEQQSTTEFGSFLVPSWLGFEDCTHLADLAQGLRVPGLPVDAPLLWLYLTTRILDESPSPAPTPDVCISTEHLCLPELGARRPPGLAGPRLLHRSCSV